MIAAPHQPFMCVWYNGYRDYDPQMKGAWGYFSVRTANKLSKMFPDRIHIEERSLLHPSWADGELPLLYQKHYDWSKNDAIHVWKRLHPVPEGPKEIEKRNCTLGEIMRYVYFLP
ncbi:hypothetical protein LSH36_65g08037 [Paralvinella palmiformis]|uniref:Uncharacterized protein n=1 Tax=Paralvinella palmiformis TaxID=53620 RepID=A0AAD9NBN8_9ANNE|nr:hypothetical protein LSH36_65g08037 [Paralvinella palmiformis]